jgi:hypothetical protein
MSMRIPPTFQITSSDHVRPIRLGGNCGSKRKGYRRTKQSHKNANSEYRRCTVLPRCEAKVKAFQSAKMKRKTKVHRRTSVETPYTIYLFSTNPCCPANCTVTFSCLLHHPDGNPVPETLDGGATPSPPPPLIPPPTPNRDGPTPAPAPMPVKRAPVIHGSSVGGATIVADVEVDELLRITVAVAAAAAAPPLLLLL